MDRIGNKSGCTLGSFTDRDDGPTSIFEAVNVDDFKGVEQLIRFGDSIDETDSEGNTPLHLAAKSNGFNAERIVDLLISEKAKINAENNIGLKPLHYAAQYSEPKVINCLIESGATVNATDNSGKTPLHYAAQYSESKVINCLIESGATVDATDNIGKTPLDYAKEWGSLKYFPTLAIRKEG